MTDILHIVHGFDGVCSCGRRHTTTVRDVRIGRGMVGQVGEILRKADFPHRLLLVADRNTLRAANGILDSLSGFDVRLHLYDDLRVATIQHVEELEALLLAEDGMAVLSVGTGSVNDPCRLACARQNRLLAIFATAPSMDGFASYGAPIVHNGFKSSFSAKSPEVIIGDTEILAAAPPALKSAGFGDMVAKYVGLIDWQVAHLLTGEYYCDRVAALTRDAVDQLMGMADSVTGNDPETAGQIFSALLMTGIAMSFTQNSRPASGAEHIVAHLMECLELREGKIPNYHGEDVGVCTLALLKLYGELAQQKSISARRESVDFEEVYRFYGSMADEVRKLNTPTVTEEVSPDRLAASWQEIRRIIGSVPSYGECLSAMRRAGCKLTVSDIEKTDDFFSLSVRYSPFMRHRLTLLRLLPMIENT